MGSGKKEALSGRGFLFLTAKLERMKAKASLQGICSAEKRHGIIKVMSGLLIRYHKNRQAGKIKVLEGCVLPACEV